MYVNLMWFYWMKLKYDPFYAERIQSKVEGWWLKAEEEASTKFNIICSLVSFYKQILGIAYALLNFSNKT